MTFLLTVVIIFVSIFGLALGTLFGRAPLRGSCGGLACIKSSECVGCNARKSADEAR